MFYVYVYMDPRQDYNKHHNGILFENEPFYVGKGKGNRIYQHLNKVKRNLKYKINDKNLRILDIINSGYDPIIKKLYINKSEKKCLDKEVEFIKSIGRLNNSGGCLLNKCDGGVWPLKNYEHSEETKRKISESSKEKTNENFKLISPNGEIYDNICLKVFCNNMNLDYQKIRKSCNKGIIKVRMTKNIKKETMNCEGWEFINKIKDTVNSEVKYLYTLISPNGDIYYKNPNDIIEFCNNMNLSRRTLMTYRNNGKIEIKNISTSSVKTINCIGWEFMSEDGSKNNFETTRKIKYKLISPKGDIFLVKNLLQFTKDNSLSYRTLQENMNKGKIKNKIFRTEKVINTQDWEIISL